MEIQERTVILMLTIEHLNSVTGCVMCAYCCNCTMLADTTETVHHGKNAEFQFVCRIDVDQSGKGPLLRAARNLSCFIFQESE